jgi:hypothetical protein
MTNNSDILSKIKKLLSLSNSSNVHEAELAASRAQALMLEYKISISEFDSFNEERSPIGENFVEDLGKYGLKPWKSILVNGISKLNGCKAIKWHGKKLKIPKIILMRIIDQTG